MTSLFRSHHTQWTDCSIFEVASIGGPGQKIVVFDDANRKNAALAGLSTSIAGRNSGLPDNYGFAHSDLAVLMTAWRDRALTGR
jgi:hypothetical protein